MPLPEGCRGVGHRGSTPAAAQRPISSLPCRAEGASPPAGLWPPFSQPLSTLSFLRPSGLWAVVMDPGAPLAGWWGSPAPGVARGAPPPSQELGSEGEVPGGGAAGRGGWGWLALELPHPAVGGLGGGRGAEEPGLIAHLHIITK